VCPFYLPQCQYQPDPSKQNSPCDDVLVCTENDTCSNGVCAETPVICEKLDVCDDYHCDPVRGCIATPNSANCNDSNACTYNDVCRNGVCSGTPVNREDGDVCTNNYCESGIANSATPPIIVPITMLVPLVTFVPLVFVLVSPYLWRWKHLY